MLLKPATAHKEIFALHRSHPYFCKAASDLSEVDRVSLQNSLSAARTAMRFLSKHQDYRVRLPVVATLDSDVSGVISKRLLWSDITTALDWTSLSSLFDEFRIHAVEFICEPKNKYSKVTTISRPIIMTHDNDGNSAPSTYDQVAEYPQCRTSNTDDLYHVPITWVRDARPESILPGEMWTDVADASTSVGATLIYSDSLTASANYGVIFQYYIVDFRFAR